MPKHTPGPWQAEWSTREGYHESGIKGWHVFAPADETGGVICDIPDDSSNRMANAELIADAPAMLAILRTIHRFGLSIDASGRIAELLAKHD